MVPTALYRLKIYLVAPQAQQAALLNPKRIAIFSRECSSKATASLLTMPQQLLAPISQGKKRSLEFVTCRSVTDYAALRSSSQTGAKREMTVQHNANR